MQENPERYKAVKDWHYDFILTRLRDTECSLLLERFFDSNTLLHVAVSLGHDQIVETILSKQQCQQQLFNGDAKMKIEVPLFIDVEEREPSISKRVPQKSSMDPNLYKAVKSKDIDFIKIIAQGTEQPSLSDKTPELNTILHLAAASSDDDHQFVQGSLEIQLCQKFVTEKNSNGDLSLHVAASAGNMQIVEVLVKLSNEQLKDHCDCVPLVEKNMEENAPLHLALIKNFQVGRTLALKAKYNKVAKLLVEKCPEVSYYPNKERESPLYLAAEGGDEKLMKLMINYE